MTRNTFVKQEYHSFKDYLNVLPKHTGSDWEAEEPLFPMHTNFASVFPASQEDAKHEISKSRHFHAQSISHQPQTLPILGIVGGNSHLNKAAAAAITAALPLGKTDLLQGDPLV